MKKIILLRWSVVICFSLIVLCSWGFGPYYPAPSSVHGVLENRDENQMLQVGEELEYSVHYSFFNLGSIRLTIQDKNIQDGKIVYRASAFMDSNPSLSWLVNLHVRFYSIFNEDIFSYRWRSEDSSTKQIEFQIMQFDYIKKKMFFAGGSKDLKGEFVPQYFDTISISDYCQDGLSLFYYARKYIHQKNDVYVPTCISNSQKLTSINFLNEHQGIEIDAVKYPIDCIHFEGEAKFKGIFGLTGEFEGWFSNDMAGVPIKARMKVVLGSVHVELEKWKRTNWVAPKWIEN